MKRLSLIALVVGALLAALLSFGVQAQDPQKPAPQEPAAAPAPAPGQEPDPKIIIGLMECLAEGLPEGWKKTWFVIHSAQRQRSFLSSAATAASRSSRLARTS